MKTNQQSNRVSRRQFLAGASAAAAFTLVPRHVLAASGTQAPSDKLNIAGVGIGGMGKSNVGACKSQNIVALCDVDWAYAKDVFNEYPNARKWKDYRKMLDEQKDIDAVIIATPDHAHAVIAMEAMRRGKHVYVQKPMTHTVYEARMLTEAARKYKVVTQMGNQGHSGDGVRKICEWIWAGIIGDVKEAHAWTNRPVWPQGIDRPTDTPAVPQDLDWDLWLGPAPDAAVQSGLSPLQVARLVGFRLRRPGRYGLPCARSGLCGPEAQVSDLRRGVLDAGQQGDLSRRVDRSFRVPCPRIDARRQVELVRWRP